ncbi:carbon-nitrogen hydrolase family protein [Brevibacillus borstelensis]|uniref:carbon-nitrogen hydrolase family protein n=1 Tax=Brevibacillus borstelensis TaxID=45462 RepID=UPI0030BC4578
MAKIYLAQMMPELLDKGKNLLTMKSCMERAAQQQADLILFPELSLTGYFTREKSGAMAEDVEGPSISQMRRWAMEYNLKVIFGFVEKARVKPYNSACFINNDGQILGTYQKNHLWDEEYKYFSAGESGRVWETDIGRIGIMICYDTEFPETARMLALQGADMILAPTANMSPLEHSQRIFIQSRAMENQIFVATTNRVGTEETTYFFGESAAADPYGNLLVLGDQTVSGYLVAFDLDKINEARNLPHYLRDRKPASYGLLTSGASKVL